MKLEGWRLLPAALLLIGLLVLGACAKTKTTSVGPIPNSQTHWLKSCDRNDDCGGLSCTCGVCLQTCSNSSQCDALAGTTCQATSAAASVAQCGGEAPIGLCLQACDSCADDQQCVGGACVRLTNVDTDAGVLPDAGDTGLGDAATSGKPRAGVMHAACSTPFPNITPALPDTRFDISGRPGFDLWRDMSCSEVASSPDTALCSVHTGDCGMCLGSVEDDGVCASGDIDVWCDGEGELFSLAPGCFTCASIAAHALACCEGMNVDCRSWPYPEDSQRGMACARHADCEPGLVCGPPPDGSGYGICHCPEEPSAPRDLVTCPELMRLR